MAFIDAIGGLVERPIIGEFMIDILLFLVPLWTAFLVGLMVGWAWRPSWANLRWSRLDCFVSKIVSAPSSPEDCGRNADLVLPSKLKTVDVTCSSSKPEGEERPAVDESDFQRLLLLVEEKDGGPSWTQMMDRSTRTMRYRAWRRDAEAGPPQYRSSTIYEDATPVMLRDFFWDDEFRVKWDDMLVQAKTLEECHTTGTMVVHWIRKVSEESWNKGKDVDVLILWHILMFPNAAFWVQFPLFCSDREYIIGRRIWESERIYYCVTKGVPHPCVPRRDKPRRVDLYYSSWCIRAVESRRGNGEMTACEVLLFHHEDMGIPREIAKLGVRQGMWGAVKKIEPGLRAYQKARASGEPLSDSSAMARVNTRLRSLAADDDNDGGSSKTGVTSAVEKREGRSMQKVLLFGGAAVLAWCTLDRGLLSKAVSFGVSRRLGRIGGKL